MLIISKPLKGLPQRIQSPTKTNGNWAVKGKGKFQLIFVHKFIVLSVAEDIEAMGIHSGSVPTTIG